MKEKEGNEMAVILMSAAVFVPALLGMCMAMFGEEKQTA